MVRPECPSGLGEPRPWHRGYMRACVLPYARVTAPVRDCECPQVRVRDCACPIKGRAAPISAPGQGPDLAAV